MSVALKIKLATGAVKTMRFTSEMSVSEACEQIFEKAPEAGGADHGLFLPSVEGRIPAKWLAPEKTLQFYDLQSDTLLEYRKKHRQRKVKMLDETTKTILLDEATTVQECVEGIADKIGIKNPEEFSLQKEGGSGEWLKSGAILGEIGLADEDILVLKKKFFFNDANIDRNDPVQLHLLYIQCRDSVVESKYPTTKDEARDLAAIQAQVTFGDHTAARTTGQWLNLKEFLPLQWQKIKGVEKEIAKEYRKLVGMSDVNAKHPKIFIEYWSLRTYGITSFIVKTRDPVKKNKLKDIVLGVTRESVIFMDFETKETQKTYKLTHIKRWAAADKSFTFDFGDYEPDYCDTYTPESEQIAQLISGYIEIIMKTKRDAGKIVSDKDNLVASEERIAMARRGVNTAITTSTSQGPGSNSGPSQFTALGNMAGSQIPGSQKIAITDLQSALRATDLLLVELIEAENAPRVPGQQFSTTLTPQQYKQQLVNSANAAASLAMAMLNDVNQPPAGGLQALRSQLTAKAQQIMTNLSVVGKNAQNAIYVNGVTDQAVDIMDASKKLAGAIAKMMKAAVAAEDGSEEAKLALAQATYAAHATGLLMATACESGYASLHSQLLVEECAKAIAACGLLLSDLSTTQADQADASLKREIHGAIGDFKNANEQLVITAEILAPVSANADVVKKIAETSQQAQAKARGIMAAYRKTTTIGQPLLDALNQRAQDMLAAIDLLTASVDCADLKATTQDGAADLGEEFTAASTALTQAFAGLKGSSKDVSHMRDRVQEITAATNKLLGCCRHVAARSDPATQNRLLLAAKASLDAVNTQDLAAACKVALLNPGDSVAHDKMLEAASHLQSVNQQIVADAGKIASVSSLCDSAKQMVAMVQSLASAVRSASVDLPPTVGQPVEKNAREVAENMPRLVQAIKRVIQNPNSEKPQLDLLEMAQRTALPPMNLVSASKRLAPKVTDPNNKQRLVLAADATSQAVQKLMAACETYKQIGGHVEIEEALEAFAATIADLDTAEIAAQGGFLEVVQGQTRENTVELLTMAIKTTNTNNAQLNDVARSNPAQLGATVKNCTAAASQVAMAAKGVASATAGKPAQKKILATAKVFAQQMEQLIRAARTLSSNPNDPSADLLMDSSLQDISATLANLVGSSVQIDSRELDEAAASILAEVGKQLGIRHASNTGKFQAHQEELESAIKALNAAVLQVVGMARNKNLKGLGSAAKITAATVPTLVQASNNAAKSSDNENTQEATATQALTQQIVALFDHAKARIVNSKDPVYDQNLTQGAKSVSDATTKLLRSLGSTANKDCEDAIDAILDAIGKLEQSSLQQLQTLSSQNLEALGQVHQAALQDLANGARALGVLTNTIVSSASSGSTQLGDASRQAAETVSELISAANKVYCAAACSVPQNVFVPAKNILDSGVLLLNAGGNIPQIINSARTVSTATQQLLQAAKDRAQSYENNSEIQDKLLQSSQRVANSTANLAKAAKALAGKQPDGPAMMTSAVKDLEAATKALLIAASYPAEESPNLIEDINHLLSNSRNVANSSSTLISASMHVSAKPRDSALQAQLSDAAAALAATIKDLLKAGAGMMPGVVECQEASEVAQKASAELTSASLAIAVDMSIGKGIPHQKCQEDLVTTARNIGNEVFQLGRAAHQSPEAIGKCALQISALLPSLVTSSKQAVATITDPEVQNEIVEQSKSVADSVLKLTQAATRASSNPTKETYEEVLKHVELSEAAIGQLASYHASDVNLLRDLDDAVTRISKSTAALNQPPVAEPGSTYQEWKDELTTKSRNLAGVMKNIVTVDKSNVVLISNAAREVADLIPTVIEAVRQACAHTADNAVKSQVTAAATQLVASTVEILKSSKLAATDKSNPAHNQEIGKQFKNATTAITKMLASAKQGAVGEVMSDSAVEQISKAISDIEAFSLFAAAGQLLEGDETTHTQAAQEQKEMFNAAKALIVASSQFVGSTKGTQEQLGAAAGGVSATVAKLVKHSKDFASGLNEANLQQEVLTAAKAVGIASQQLVLAGKDAQRFKKDPTAARSLSKAAEGLAESVGGLVNRAHSSLAEAQKGLRELENVHNKIQSILAQINSLPANDTATAVDLATAARAVADTSAQMVSSYHVSQEELAKAAAAVYTANAKLLSNTKGATRLVTDDATKAKLVDKAKSISTSLLSLISSVKDQSKDPNSGKKIHEASDAVASGISDMVKLSRTLPGGSSIQIEESEAESDDLEELAEKELMNAAKKIEEAAAALLAARPKPKPKPAGAMLDSEDIALAIVDASTTIAQAVAKLVSSAAVAQSKRRQATKISGRYRKDPVWANGLISAARTVASSTHALVSAANKAVQGKAEEEELIATARSVAAATAQLVAASRAKSDDQTSHTQLSGAAKAVASATSQLVAAAKAATEWKDKEEATASANTEDYKFTGFKVKELEQQMKILKLEKELETARRQMLNSRKQSSYGQ